MDVSDDDSDFEVPQSKRSKRRNASAEEDSDDDDGDNGEDDDEEEANPYPLEGLYKDEADRQRLGPLPFTCHSVLAKVVQQMLIIMPTTCYAHHFYVCTTICRILYRYSGSFKCPK